MKAYVFVIYAFILISCRSVPKSQSLDGLDSEKYFARIEQLGFDSSKLYFTHKDLAIITHLEFVKEVTQADNMVYYSTFSFGDSIRQNEVILTDGGCAYLSDEVLKINQNNSVKSLEEFILTKYPLENKDGESPVVLENDGVIIMKYAYSLGLSKPKSNFKRVLEFLDKNPTYDYVILSLDRNILK